MTRIGASPDIPEEEGTNRSALATKV